MRASRARSLGRRLLLAAVIVILVVASSVFAVNREFDATVDDIPRVEVTGLATPTGSAQNFLVVGSDTREFVGDDPQAQEKFGARDETGGNRSDTLMIVHADADGGFVVSFPRDLWVEIPGVGGSKINAAFNDGPSKVVETIVSNFDVPIHHFLEMNFADFSGLVDAVGGVPVYFPAPARDQVTGLAVTSAPACVVLDGGQALAYVRSRSYEEMVNGEWVQDATADIGRIGRQQTFMRRLAAETIETATAQPFQARDIANATLEFLTADASLRPDDMRLLLDAFRTVNPDDPESLEMITIPWTTGQSQGGQSVLYLDDPGAGEVLARLRDPGAAPASRDELVAPSTVRLRVLNGTNTAGLAGESSDAFAGEGFVPAGTGDTTEKPVAITQVRYRPGGEAQARTVQQYLGGIGELVEDSEIVDADVVVVLGTDFSSIVVPDATDATAAPAPAAPGVMAAALAQAPAPGC